MFHLSAVLALGAMVFVGWLIYKRVKKIWISADIANVEEKAQRADELAKRASGIDVEQYKKNKEIIKSVESLEN